MRTIWRIFPAWETDRYELWLNHMCHNGWMLEQPGTLWHQFRTCKPGEFTFRLAYPLETEELTHQFILFNEENGAPLFRKTKQVLFFCKQDADCSFTLFSDIESKISALTRRQKMLRRAACAWLLLFPFIIIINTVFAWLLQISWFAALKEHLFYLIVSLLWLFFLLVIPYLSTKLKLKRLKQERTIHE